MWQDYTMTAISIGFSYSLFPQLWYNYKHKEVAMSWQPILITGIGLLVYAYCLTTLGTVVAGITSATTGISWLAIGVQKLIYKKD